MRFTIAQRVHRLRTAIALIVAPWLLPAPTTVTYIINETQNGSSATDFAWKLGNNE